MSLLDTTGLEARIQQLENRIDDHHAEVIAAIKSSLPPIVEKPADPVVVPAPTPTEPKTLPDFAEAYRRFPFIGPGGLLPSPAQVAEKIVRSPWEPRPENTPANRYDACKAKDFQITQPWTATWGWSKGGEAKVYQDGALLVPLPFPNMTTWEILQFGAGIHGLSLRDVLGWAIVESTWDQTFSGDKESKTGYADRAQAWFQERIQTWPDRTDIPISDGIMQIKQRWAQDTQWAALRSTWFNVNYALARARCVTNGWGAWLNQYGDFPEGDFYHAAGSWKGSRWNEATVQGYIANVRKEVTAERWKQPGTFGLQAWTYVER